MSSGSFSLYIYAERRVRRRIALVPFGAVEGLREIDVVDWVRLSRPRLHDARACHAIVADFRSDLPDEWEAFLADAALSGRIVYQVKQLADSLIGRVELEHLSENSFGSLLPAGGYLHLKALLDWLLAAAMLPFALLIMAAAAVAIRMESRGPVLFRQRRLGHAGRIFTAYKFRTMTVLHEGGDEQQIRRALATEHDDPRVTRVAAVLRKYRIDEIPQMFNILRGEMS
jgi:hypothetical protein